MGFTADQILEFKECFAVYDENADGFLESNDVPKCMRACLIPLSEHEAEEIICDMDIYGTCQADWPAFLELMEKHWKPLPKIEEVEKAFMKLDADGSGSISRDELTNYLGNLGEKLSEEEIEKLIKDVDKDGDGEIDYKEFVAYMKI